MASTTLRLVVIALVLVTGFTLRSSWEELAHPDTAAQAQEDIYDCADFATQEEAQAVYKLDPTPSLSVQPRPIGWSLQKTEFYLLQSHHLPRCGRLSPRETLLDSQVVLESPA